jgi:hypothetical protein
MNPDDPSSAQLIVAEYARLLERDGESGQWPGCSDALPYPKQTIKSAIRTSLLALTSSGDLTSELQEFLEDAYVALADYISPDLAKLMSEYQRAGSDLAADPRLAREKTAGAAWRTIAETGTLAGEIARSIASEAQELRAEFRGFM